MINWDRKLPDVCSPPPPPPPLRCVTEPCPFDLQEFLEQHPAEAMIAVAGVGAGIAAIAGAPILVIVGVGIGIAMATKYALTANHTLPFM